MFCYKFLDQPIRNAFSLKEGLFWRGYVETSELSILDVAGNDANDLNVCVPCLTEHQASALGKVIGKIVSVSSNDCLITLCSTREGCCNEDRRFAGGWTAYNNLNAMIEIPHALPLGSLVLCKTRYKTFRIHTSCEEVTRKKGQGCVTSSHEGD